MVLIRGPFDTNGQSFEFHKTDAGMGLTLKEMDKLLGTVNLNEARYGDVYDFTVLKLGDIQHKIQDLKLAGMEG